MIIRNTLLLLLLNVLHIFAANTNSHSTILTNEFKGASVKEFVEKIEENKFLFLYTSELFNETKQPQTITGVVTDEKGEPLVGASVSVKGSTIGTVTDLMGRYTLSVPADAELLIYSFIGMKTQEVLIDNRTIINILLQEETLGLDEVVVIGYGSQKRSDLTGAVSSIKASDLQKTPIASIDQGLIGRAAGVMVTQTSGMPGAVASIRIRGTSSLEGGNEPLYVIDGFPIYSGAGFGSTAGNARLSGLSSFNPGDIVSIEILKDASATAIYGARAANGVVLITTKRGEEGNNQITFDANYGVQTVAKKYELMNAQEYAELVNEVYTSDGQPPYYNAAALTEIATPGFGTDWQDEIYRIAPTQNYQLSFSGGNRNSVFAISGNYFDQTGIVKNSDFKRYSLRINFENKINDKFLVGTNLTGSYIDNNSIISDGANITSVITQAFMMNPVLPVFSNKETREFTQINSPGNNLPNPVGTLEQTRNTSNSRLSSNIFAEWEILKDLKAKVSFGADVSYIKNNTYIPSYIFQGGGLGEGTVGVNKSMNVLNENTLTWNKVFNDSHTFNVLAGFTTQTNQVETVSASSGTYVNDVLTFNNLGSGTVYNQPGSSYSDWSLMSYLGRLNYSFNNKYLFSVNGRVDGSSRFGADNKFGFFPSGAFAWRISDEDFMSSIKDQINNLKLRISYGFTGNTEIGIYNALSTIGTSSYIIGGKVVTGFSPNRIPNPDLKWEKTGQFDVGLDIGLYNNRLRITTDYYVKKTTDLLYSVSIPYVSGFSTMLQNIGSVENKGFEFLIESDNLSGAFKWATIFNIAFNKNKVLELGGEQFKELAEGSLNGTGTFRRLIVNEPLGIFYGYRFDGIFQNAEEVAKQTSAPVPIGLGYRRFKDLNGDGIIDAANDREILGDSNPDFFGGFTNVFSYKRFELNVFLQYSYGNKIFNYDKWILENVSANNNAFKYMVNRWKPDSPSDIYPKAARNYANLSSDQVVEDGSYLKLKSVSLSYDLPVNDLKFISAATIYISGQNLITWTKFTGLDPDLSFRGTSALLQGESFGGYPPSRTIMFGAKFNF